MDECCIEFCKKLDEWIQDEENSTKEYHAYARKAKNNNQPLVGTILETLSIDENKHVMALTDAAMIICSVPDPLYPASKNIKLGKKQVTFYE